LVIHSNDATFSLCIDDVCRWFAKPEIIVRMLGETSVITRNRMLAICAALVAVVFPVLVEAQAVNFSMLNENHDEKPVLSEEEKAYAERIKEAHQQVESLTKAVHEAHRAGRIEEANQLAKKLYQAREAKMLAVREIREKSAEAVRQGKREEAKRWIEVYRAAYWEIGGFGNTNIPYHGMGQQTVVISEVCYWPADGECEWIELTNISPDDVDVSAWVLVDGQSFRLTLPEKLPVLGPDECLVIALDGTGQAPEKKGGLFVHSPAGLTGNLLGDSGGHLALYSSDELSMTTICSFVAWGKSPGMVIMHALSAKLWGEQSSAISGTELGPVMGADTRQIQKGGVVGLKCPPRLPVAGAANYGVFLPQETSPGRENRFTTVTVPKNRPIAFDSDGMFILSCVSFEDSRVKYHFQVCWDQECEKVQQEGPPAVSPVFRSLKPIPPGETLFWRVMAYLPDGSQTAWSKPRAIRR
jgi:hypothetical protein